jgi:sortase A
LDKLQAGDGFVVIWSGKEYDYQVVGSKIVLPTEVSVLAPTEKPTLTLITCDPIFSQQNRLIVTAELVSK